MSETIIIEINENSEDLRDIEVYPNPITPDDLLNIDITTSSTYQMTGEIHDMKGSIVKTLQESEIQVGLINLQIDVSDLLPAAYILRVKLSDKVFVEKITIVEYYNHINLSRRGVTKVIPLFFCR